ncbi:MAG TPA: LacI family DNA-binding transcriptional regulator [Aggregatilinea sp.]|uniref:LacI family DNA-binding transcriptional regulator n=1 Tax=Aggregatilinea sp. TaxID=2806333 RepID=UPI002B738F9A|nr:LacI family DNA-binding transcriptional regulator [Aggregatilinea sp.]HML21602.1 LacI family DNA-binding transcriptional regulator [Aggregatilinea sp.]
MPPKKRPRLADVAKMAGVSEATVSVVLNNRVGESVRVSEQTQQRIWDVVRKLGYVANPVARSLAGGRNNILAVFTFDPVFPIGYRNFYYPFLVGIEEQAASLGYNLLLVTSADDLSGKRHIYRDGVNTLQAADGALLLGYENKAEVVRLLDEGFPFVFVGRRESPNDTISYVACDYKQGTIDVIEHLESYGHRRIAYMQSSSETESSQDRQAGYVEAVEASQQTIDPALIWKGAPQTFTQADFKRLLEAGVTALVAENDECAERILTLAGALKLDCPRDFSLAVLGDPLTPTETDHAWTMFKIPRREMGSESVRLLHQILTAPDQTLELPLRQSLPCEFKPGNSVAPPP